MTTPIELEAWASEREKVLEASEVRVRESREKAAELRRQLDSRLRFESEQMLRNFDEMLIEAQCSRRMHVAQIAWLSSTRAILRAGRCVVSVSRHFRSGIARLGQSAGRLLVSAIRTLFAWARRS